MERCHLANPPGEIVDQVFKSSSHLDLVHFARTSKEIRTLAKPYMYRDLFADLETDRDLCALVVFLQTRPAAAERAEDLFISDYDPTYIRSLLKIEMPSLKSLTISYDHYNKKHLISQPDQTTNLSSALLPKLRDSKSRQKRLTFRFLS